MCCCWGRRGINYFLGYARVLHYSGFFNFSVGRIDRIPISDALSETIWILKKSKEPKKGQKTCFSSPTAALPSPEKPRLMAAPCSAFVARYGSANSSSRSKFIWFSHLKKEMDPLSGGRCSPNSAVRWAKFDLGPTAASTRYLFFQQ